LHSSKLSAGKPAEHPTFLRRNTESNIAQEKHNLALIEKRDYIETKNHFYIICLKSFEDIRIAMMRTLENHANSNYFFKNGLKLSFKGNYFFNRR
jgi:hypothetical protein